MKIIQKDGKTQFVLEATTMSGTFEEMAEIFNILAKKDSTDTMSMEALAMQARLSAQLAKNQEGELALLREMKTRLDALDRDVTQMKSPDHPVKLDIKLDKPRHGN